VTGGVVSSLGKGIAAASLASILESRGLSVSLLKLILILMLIWKHDPFHMVKSLSRRMGRTDLDLGHYERFGAYHKCLRKKQCD